MHNLDITMAIKMCQEVVTIKERLHRLGLHKTANRMQAAVEAIGSEVAEHIENQKGK